MTLTWFDFIVIGILLFSTFRGLQRGFVWQLAWIAALVLCFGCAESFSLQLAPKIQEFAPQAKPPLNRWIAMLILYLGFSFLSFGVARVLHGWIEKAKFKEYDRHLGAMFGFVKGVLICLVGTFFIITLSERARDTVLVSKSGHAAAVIMDQLQPVLPKELAQILHPYVQKLDPNHEGELDAGQTDPFSDSNDLLFGNSDEAPNGNGSTPGNSDTGLDNLWDLLPGNEDRSGNGNTTDTANMSLEDFVRTLPASMSRELKQSAADAYRNATPEQRQELLSKVRSALPGELGNAMDKVNELRNRWNDLNQPTENPQAQANRDNILMKISHIFSDHESARTKFRQDVNQRLTGVPGSVASGVLNDWQADLTGNGSDPDPTTNARTRFDVRIYRQLQAAGIRVDQLSQSLQDRMRNVSRQ